MSNGQDRNIVTISVQRAHTNQPVQIWLGWIRLPSAPGAEIVSRGTPRPVAGCSLPPPAHSAATPVGQHADGQQEFARLPALSPYDVPGWRSHIPNNDVPNSTCPRAIIDAPPMIAISNARPLRSAKS